jgi:hypothetical protein
LPSRPSPRAGRRDLSSPHAAATSTPAPSSTS